jgi:hypothetical protein
MAKRGKIVKEYKASEQPHNQKQPLTSNVVVAPDGPGRKFMRELRFGSQSDSTAKRRTDSTRYTRPTMSRRRRTNRLKNRIARAARKRNRD